MNLKAHMPESIALSYKVSTAQNKVVTELNEVSSGIEDMINMEGFLGKAANSAKGYFEDVHLTTVLAFQQLMIEMDDNLKKHINTFHSYVDTSQMTIIDSHYLHEVKADIESLFTPWLEIDEEVNSAIDSVSDIVSVSKPSISQVQSNKDSIVRLVEESIENLEGYTTIRNERVKEMIYHVKALMNDIQSYKGKERFQKVNRNQFVDPIRAVMMGEGGIFESLFEKVAENETLTVKEQSLLYYMFQNMVLTDATKAEIRNITDYMTEENIDKLKDRLNENVVHSRVTLEREIAIIEAYLYLGGMKPGKSEILTNDRSKLETYLMLLKNYDRTMGESNVIIVDRLEYEENGNDIPGHYIFSALQIEEYDDSIKDLMNEQRFRAWAFNSDNPISGKYSVSEINFYVGTTATSKKTSQEIEELKDEKATYTIDFITKKVMEKLISEVGSAFKVGEAVSTLKDGADYIEGYNGLVRDITVKEGVEAADRLGMEFGMSDTYTVPWSGEEINVELVPTDKTHDIIERWKLVQEKHPQVEVPEEDILSQDWYEISKRLKKIEVEFGTDTSNYIIDSILREDETIEDLLSDS